MRPPGMRGVPPVLLLVGSGVVLPAGLAAQDLGTDCAVEDYLTIESAPGPSPNSSIYWISEPYMVCPDGTRLASDSAVVHEADRWVELIGSVLYETEDRRLEADLADYYETEGRLFARGTVVFRDLVEGRVLRGDTLTHFRATEVRTEERVEVSGGRPSAELPGRADDTDGPEAPEPYLLTGDELRFEGETYIWAEGDVEVVRADLEADSDSLAFDRDRGQLFLIGNARVRSEADMEGRRITLTMPQDVLERVLIEERGRLWTDDLDLVGEEIRIALSDEKIQELVAVHRPVAGERVEPDPDDPVPPDPDARVREDDAPPADAPGEGADDEGPPRPRAETADFVLGADSIHVQSPDEVLELVHAVGRARGETRGRGPGPVAVGAAPDDPAEEGGSEEELERIPDLTESDWLEGDEILAFFEEVPAAELAERDAEDPEPVLPDDEEAEEGPRFRLERLEALGNARSLYRSPPREEEEGGAAEGPDAEEEGEPRRWSISYIVAREIFIYMADGAVDRMEAVDQVEGMQLEPVRRGAAPAADTGSTPEGGEEE